MAPVMPAATHLPTITKVVKTRPSSRVSRSISSAGSMLRPIETRNVGTNTAVPTNSSRSMSEPRFGTSRLRPRPARNAPIRPSTPPISATHAPADMAARANTNRCIRERPTRTKKRSPIRGSTQRQNPTSTGSAIKSGSVGSGVLGSKPKVDRSMSVRSNSSPSNGAGSGSLSMTVVEVTNASTVSDSRSATTPADTAALAARLFCSPAVWISG